MTDITFSDDQSTAVTYCIDLERRIVAVTGEAGSGKTTIMKKAVESLRKKDRRVALAAPTGRAARRIYEATGILATTVHKLLAYDKPEQDQKTGESLSQTTPGFHKEKPLPFDDVFVDEYAMINEELHRNLIDALPPGGRLLAFGDVHQLPPIENYALKNIDGSPFQRLLRSKKSAITLDKVFRQGEDSGILSNARLVKQGRPPVKKRDFTINFTESPILGLRNHLKEGDVDYRTVHNQIISPGRKGKLGVHALNAVLQAFYIPHPDDYLTLPRHKWEEGNSIRVSVGEKVICNQNTYDMRDYFERYTRWKDESTPENDSFIPVPDHAFMLNGEIGIIEEILPDGAMVIQMSDRVVQVPCGFRESNRKANSLYTKDARKDIDLAYAVTTHKMQGSECSTICFISHQSLYFNLNRNNIYTAITRAKDHVHYITDNRTWSSGMKMTAQEKEKMMDQWRKDNAKS